MSHDLRIVMYDLRPRPAEVVRAEMITPRMRRVTLGGDALDGLRCPAPADHVKLVFPDDPDGVPALPTVDERAHLVIDRGRRPILRDCTTRRHDEAAGELAIDFVLHGAGPASSWAAGARPGQRLGVLGPRGSRIVPYDFDWYLLAGDETGLPTIARWLEQLPAGARAIVLVEVADAAEEQPMSSEAGVSFRWLHRGGPRRARRTSSSAPRAGSSSRPGRATSGSAARPGACGPSAGTCSGSSGSGPSGSRSTATGSAAW